MASTNNGRVNTHDKGVRMQALCLQEFLQHLQAQTVNVFAVWNAPNLRPAKRPLYLPQATEYSNKDFLGDWDLAVWAMAFVQPREYRIQVKSAFREDEYKRLLIKWRGAHTTMYYAVYGHNPQRKADIVLPHFKLFRIW